MDLEFEALKHYADNQILASEKSKITYINGSYYEGEVINGHKNGFGKLFSPNDNIVYDGEWRDDKYHGFGELKNSFVSPLMEAFSHENMNNVQFGWISYQGEFLNGKRNGSGKLILINGDKF